MRMRLPNDWTVGDGLNTAGFRWRRRHEGTDSATGKDADTNRDHLTTRFDYQINANHKVSYTMSREEDWGVTGQTGLPTSRMDTSAKSGVHRIFTQWG